MSNNTSTSSNIGNNHRINNNNNNGTQACAACKYQRRKCAPDCILAPYFPHHRQRQFLNAHKLFGVSNIVKIIRNLNPPDKDIAMRTIIYQADVRAKDPVGGCYRIIQELQRQIEYSKAELDLVLQQLAICKAHAYNEQNQMHGDVIIQESDPLAAYNIEPLSYQHFQDDFAFESQQLHITAQSEEIILKENKVSLEEEQESLYHHHAAEHDLRTAATLFTLTN